MSRVRDSSVPNSAFPGRPVGAAQVANTNGSPVHSFHAAPRSIVWAKLFVFVVTTLSPISSTDSQRSIDPASASGWTSSGR